MMRTRPPGPFEITIGLDRSVLRTIAPGTKTTGGEPTKLLNLGCRTKAVPGTVTKLPRLNSRTWCGVVAKAPPLRLPNGGTMVPESGGTGPAVRPGRAITKLLNGKRVTTTGPVEKL